MTTTAQTQQITTVSAHETFLVENKGTLKARLLAIQIVDADSCAKAITMTKELAQLLKDVEKDKGEIYDPAKKIVDAITARYKPIIEDIKEAGAAAKAKILAWQQAENEKAEAARRAEIKRQEDEAIAAAEEAARVAKVEQDKIDAAAAAEAAKLKEEGNEAAAQAALAAAEVAKEVVKEAAEQSINRGIDESAKVKAVDTAIRAGGATSSVAKRWTYEVTDIKALPADMLEVNKGAIQAAIRDGERNVPGLRIYQEAGLSIR